MQTSLEQDPFKGQYSRGLIWGQKRPGYRNFLYILSHSTDAFRDIYGLLEASVYRDAKTWGQRDNNQLLDEGTGWTRRGVKALAS